MKKLAPAISMGRREIFCKEYAEQLFEEKFKQVENEIDTELWILYRIFVPKELEESIFRHPRPYFSYGDILYTTVNEEDLKKLRKGKNLDHNHNRYHWKTLRYESQLDEDHYIPKLIDNTYNGLNFTAIEARYRGPSARKKPLAQWKKVTKLMYARYILFIERAKAEKALDVALTPYKTVKKLLEHHPLLGEAYSELMQEEIETPKLLPTETHEWLMSLVEENDNGTIHT